MKRYLHLLIFSIISFNAICQTVPTPNYNASNPKCVGAVISFSDQSTDNPTSWSWTFPSGNPSSSNSQFPSITYSSPGNYVITLVATNSVGASSTLNATITINPNPTLSAASKTACNNSSVTFSASGANSYLWLPSNSSGASYNIVANSASIFTVIGTNTFGCESSKTVSLVVLNNPTVSVSTGSICAGTNLTLTANGAPTFSWSTGQTGSSITVSPNTDTNYHVTGIASNGCKDNAVASVSVFPLPQISATSGTTCPQQSLSIFAGGADTYTWAASSSLIPHDTNQNQAIVSPSTQTTYTVYGTDVVGCMSYTTTTVYTSLPPDFSVTSATVCPNATATLVATPISSSITSFFWSNGTNAIETSVTATATTIYTCTANTDGCSASKTTTLYIYPSPALSSTSGTVCFGKNYTLNASGAASYTWSTGSNSPSIIVTPTITTSYGFAGSSINGCVSNAIITVTVINLPVISIAPKSVCLGKSVSLSAIGATNYLWSTNTSAQSITVSPTSNTTYTCIGTAITGCSNTAITTVTVIPIPTVTLSSASICSGETATLTAGSANTYSWSNGNHSSQIYVLPTVNTSYTCVGLSINNCEFTSTTFVNVTTVPTPVITQNGGLLTSSSTTGNQWYLNGVAIPGATAQTYSATQTGNYSLIITGANGCQSQAANKTMFDTGFDDLNLSKLIHLYPNPSHETITISYPKEIKENIHLKIFGYNGQLIIETDLNQEFNTLDLTAINNGLYIFECSIKNSRTHFKVLKL